MSPQLNNPEDIITYYRNHLSIKKSRSSSRASLKILNLNNKALRRGDIQVNFLKDAIKTYLPVLTKITNSSVEQIEFPSNRKLEDVFPALKDPLSKKIKGL